MRWITAQCPACLIRQDLPPSCTLLEIAAADAEPDTGSTATWICQRCHRLVGVSIDLAVLVDLVRAGAPLLDTADKATAKVYPETITPGLPLTWDDLLDLHEQLAQPDWLNQLQCLR